MLAALGDDSSTICLRTRQTALVMPWPTSGQHEISTVSYPDKTSAAQHLFGTFLNDP